MVKAVSGDTLTGIAKANGTTVAQILTDNPTLAARAAAGTTVLFNGTNVKITAPSTATNPYGANLAGQGAGLGTKSVPISTVNSVLTKAATTPYDPLSSFKTDSSASAGSTGGTIDTSGDGKFMGENNTTDTILKEETTTGGEVIVYATPTYNAPPPPPPPPPVKTATPDIVQAVPGIEGTEAFADLLFEMIGGQEILTVARHDTVNGQDVKYQPIRNLGILQNDFNPNNLIKLQKTSETYFKNFTINLFDKIPKVGNGADGSNVYLDSTGNLVIEFINLVEGEDIDIEIAEDGTIYEGNI